MPPCHAAHRMLTSLFIIIFSLSADCEPRGTGKAGCVRWVRNFEGVKSEHVMRSCSTFDGDSPVCCAAVGKRNRATEPRGVGQENLVARNELLELDGLCHLERTYVPSPYEVRHLEFARQLMSETDSSRRLQILLRFVTAPLEIKQNYEWLHYAQLLMQGGQIASAEQAAQVLSRFDVRRMCRKPGQTNTLSESWVEWIEPISVHGRHPFAFAECRHIAAIAQAYPQRNPPEDLQEVLAGRAALRYPDSVTAVSIMNVDYLILLSSQMMHNLNGSTPGTAAEQLYSDNYGEGYGEWIRPLNKHILVDAGTSYFHSSLSWLTCAYSQVGVSFDRVLAWEKSLLNPSRYWRGVPLKWHTYWSFFNTPIGPASESDRTGSTPKPCPTELIRDLVLPQDFVVFKLDIDFPETELDIASSLLADPALLRLVDEFFFEAHFRCDVMMLCGWGQINDTAKRQIVLDRPQVLQFFQDLRIKGVRSHLWP